MISIQNKFRKASYRAQIRTATCKTLRQLVAITSSSQISGVSRISARGVLKVRPDTKSGEGGGGGAVGFWPDTKRGGGGGWGGRRISRM